MYSAWEARSSRPLDPANDGDIAAAGEGRTLHPIHTPGHTLPTSLPFPLQPDPRSVTAGDPRVGLPQGQQLITTSAYRRAPLFRGWRRHKWQCLRHPREIASSRATGGKQGAVRAVPGTFGGSDWMEPETDRSEMRQCVVHLGCQGWQKANSSYPSQRVLRIRH